MKQFVLRLGVGAAAIAATGAASASAGGPQTASDRRIACIDCGIVSAIQQNARKPKTELVAGTGAGSAALARKRGVYEVVIKMDAGGEQRIYYENRPALAVGDKVRLRQNQIYLR